MNDNCRSKSTDKGTMFVLSVTEKCKIDTVIQFMRVEC